MRTVKLISSATLALLVLVATACVASTSTPATLSPIVTSTQTPARAAFPVTVTDVLGRNVTVPSLPDRIISLAPSNTEVLFAVGAGNLVVGVTSYDNYPPETLTRDKVGGFYANSISVEKIVNLKPALVFSAGKAQVSLIPLLEQAGIRVVALDPSTFEEVYDNIALVGRLTGHSEEADRVVAQMKDRVAAIREKTASVPKEKRATVFYEVWNEPLMTAGPSTFIGQMIDLAGGVNIFSDVTTQYPQVSTEEVIMRNPSVILGPDTHGDKLTPEQVAQRPGWGQIDAVKNGNVHLVNGDIVSRPGPRLADALEAIAKAIYPNLFP